MLALALLSGAGAYSILKSSFTVLFFFTALDIIHFFAPIPLRGEEIFILPTFVFQFNCCCVAPFNTFNSTEHFLMFPKIFQFLKRLLRSLQ